MSGEQCTIDDSTPSGQLSGEIVKILAPFEVPSDSHRLLLQSYRSPDRFYHDSGQPLRMLNLIRSLDIEFDDYKMQCLKLGIIYRYAWFEIESSRGTNEWNSAQWLRTDLLSSGSTKEMIGLYPIVERAILSTAKHIIDKKHLYYDVIATLHDLDLWGLGQESGGFEKDHNRKWLEFETIKKRDKFDTDSALGAYSFLNSRDTIFKTEPFLKFEEMAQSNLKRLIAKAA